MPPSDWKGFHGNKYEARMGVRMEKGCVGHGTNKVCYQNEDLGKSFQLLCAGHTLNVRSLAFAWTQEEA